MNTMKINTKQITSIHPCIKSVCGFYIFKKQKKFLWFEIRKEGFYKRNFRGFDYVSNEIILKQKELYIENNEVYFIPHIDIFLSDGNMYTKYYDRKIKDEKELYTVFMNDIRSNKFLKIKIE